MRTVCHVSLLAVCLAPYGYLRAAEKPEAIVEKAIEAQGGAAKVAKLRTMRIKVEGKADLIPGNANLPFTIEDAWMMPDRYKSTFTCDLMGMKYTQSLVIDGETGWSEVNGKVDDLLKSAVAEMKEQKYAEDLDRLGFLKEKGYELALLEEAKVNDKPAVGVLVKSKGHRDVKLYFDKETGLLVKRVNKLVEGDSEIVQEVFLSDYQEKDGLKHYMKIAAHRDGKKVLDGKVTELEFVDKFEDNVFAKP